jgi:hypothetical protein
MVSTRSVARRLGLGILLLTVAASAGACSSKSVVENFTAKVSASDFQASGAATGTLSVSVSGQKFNGTAKGSFKVKGKDSSTSLSLTIAGSARTMDAIDVAGYAYSSSNGTDWTKVPQTASRFNLQDMTSGGVTYKGVESHGGKQLHHLTLNDAPDATAIFGDASESPLSSGKFTVDFWANDDGSPAAMTIAGTWSQDVAGVSGQASITLEFTFERLSGVTIESPI